MLGLAILPALVQALGFIFLMPESARHLLESGERDKAKAVLQKIRGTNDVDDEFLKISDDINQSKNENFMSLFSTSNGRHALFVGCSLQFFQQFTGINTVMYYSATIIYMSGMVTDPQAAIWFSGFAKNKISTFFIIKAAWPMTPTFGAHGLRRPIFYHILLKYTQSFEKKLTFLISNNSKIKK